MKRLVWFIIGLVVGVAGTLGYFYLSNAKGEDKNYEMTFFETPGQVMLAREYRVIQAWPNGTALAMDLSLKGNMDEFLVTVLLWNKKHDQYYDGQTIKASKNQQFRQIGLCRYMSQDQGMKTVPIVELTDK